MTLTAVDAMAAPDVVGADMTVDADTGAVAMTVADVMNDPQTHIPQTHTPSATTNALIKKPLTALNPSY